MMMNDARRTFGLTERRARRWKSAWSPKMLSSLWAWYPMWAQRPWSHGQKITVANDAGPNGFHMQQATETRKPTWEGSAGTPYFDGGDMLEVPNVSLSTTKLLLWAVVGDANSYQYPKIWNLKTWASSGAYSCEPNRSAPDWTLYGNGFGGGGPLTRGTKTQNVSFIVIAINNIAGQGFFRENGVDRTTVRNGGTMTVVSSQPMRIGSRQDAGEGWVGAIAELGLAINWTDQDIEQLEKYLKTFYGF